MVSVEGDKGRMKQTRKRCQGTHTHTHTHTHARTHAHTCTHTRTHMHTHMHTHTAHTHTPKQAAMESMPVRRRRTWQYAKPSFGSLTIK